MIHMIHHPSSYYAHKVRSRLPAHAFEAVPSRLAWLLFHLSLIVAAVAVIGRSPLWVAPFLSILIGHSFAGCAFVGHETMHGAVVRGRWLRYAVGWICFLPFTLSPRLWVAWHNKVHHGHTMADGVDPDAYPTLASYR